MSRYLLPITLLSLAVSSAAVVRGEGTERETKGGSLMKAVVHVNFSDSERQKHGLKNVTNMLKEEKGNIEIEVVCHGGGIGLLVKGQSQHAAEVERLGKEGVRFVACENTMRDKKIAKEELLEGVETVPSGAIEVVKKQQEGYGYFKP